MVSGMTEGGKHPHWCDYCLYDGDGAGYACKETMHCPSGSQGIECHCTEKKDPPTTHTFQIRIPWYVKDSITGGFRYRLGTEQATSHYLTQWWPISPTHTHTHIYMYICMYIYIYIYINIYVYICGTRGDELIAIVCLIFSMIFKRSSLIKPETSFIDFCSLSAS